MMTCEQFRERLDDTARDDASAAAGLRDALAHADSCPDCDALLEEAESLTDALRGWARRDGTEAPRRVEEVLLAAFRRQHDAVSAREISRPKSVRLFFLSALGMAAAIFLVIFLVRNTNRATPPVGKSQPRISIPSEAPAQGLLRALRARGKYCRPPLRTMKTPPILLFRCRTRSILRPSRTTPWCA